MVQANVLSATITIGGTLTINTGSRYDLNGISHALNIITILGTGYTFPSMQAAPPASQGTLDLGGGETITGTKTLGTASGNVRYHGITAGAYSLPLGSTYYNLVFDQDASGTTWTPSGNVVVNNVMNDHDGTFALTTHNLTVTGLTMIDGGHTAVYFGGILTNTTGTLNLNGGLQFSNEFGGSTTGFPGGAPALTAGSGPVNITGDVTGAGLFTASSGTTTFGGSLVLYDGTISSPGNIGTFTANGGLARFNGGGTRTEYVNGASFANLTILGGTTLQAVNNSGGGANAFNVTGTLTTSTASDVMDVTTQAFTIAAMSNTGTLAIDGTQTTQTAVVDTAKGIVNYYGTIAGTRTVMLTSFYNLTISGTGQTFTLGGATTVANNLTITGGTYSMGTVAGGGANDPLLVSITGSLSIANGALDCSGRTGYTTSATLPMVSVAGSTTLSGGATFTTGDNSQQLSGAAGSLTFSGEL